MLSDKSDHTWERLGRNDPYFAVLTDPRFRGATISGDLQSEFFQSGVDHIAWLTRCVERYFGGFANARSALDFGCGVGRLVIPLARGFDDVVGVDVSPAMLKEAASNCTQQGVQNVKLVRSDDELSQLDVTFDFIHSVMTLQHIAPPRGEAIIRRLLSRLRPNGIIALQFYFFRQTNHGRRILGELRKILRPLHWVANTTQGKRWDEPLMQHNVYDLRRILRTLRENGIEEAHVQMTEIGGAFLFAQKLT
jgi:SAM-dependent methyltransferase